MFQLSVFEELNRIYSPIQEKIYDKGYIIKPHLPSKQGPKYLTQLLPLEDYDHILVGYSGGKDSLAAVLYLLDLGVPKEKITLLHHCIDGRDKNQILEMDWSCTREYCIQSAKALGVKIKFSWREGGFAGEMFRLGPSKPITFEEIEGEDFKITYGANWQRGEELQKLIKETAEKDNEKEMEQYMQELKSYGYRYKWPAKTASLSTRWCSSSLKIEVFDRMMRYSQATMQDSKVLFIDGIRREESPNRGRYNEMEIHGCNAPTKNRQLHHWRCVIEWPEEMVWDKIKQHGVRPHPAYMLGWSRCSCASCIFSLPQHFAGIKQLMPCRFQRMCEIEKELGFTLDTNGDLESYISHSKSCVPDNPDPQLIKIINDGQVPFDYVKLKNWETWTSPAGAFHGSAGGPC